MAAFTTKVSHLWRQKCWQRICCRYNLQRGYLHNQVLFTKCAMRSELLSNISSFLSNSLPFTFIVRCLSTTGSSTISNQLEAGSIMVRAMKLICEPSLPLRMYGPMRSTHKASQGILITVFARRCPYLSFRFLFVWQVLQDLVIDRMVVRIPFQYIAALIVSSRRVCPCMLSHRRQWQWGLAHSQSCKKRYLRKFFVKNCLLIVNH